MKNRIWMKVLNMSVNRSIKYDITELNNSFNIIKKE